MATAPLTTILIDTYNYSRFIEQAIDSVLAQEFPQEQKMAARLPRSMRDWRTRVVNTFFYWMQTIIFYPGN